MALGRLVGLLATLALLVALGLFLLASSRQAKRPSGAALLSTMLRDAVSRGSAHETADMTVGRQQLAFSDDVSTVRGRQLITMSGGAQAQVLVVGDVAYLAGNQVALADYFKFPTAYANAIGLNWMSIPSSSTAYASVASDATLRSALSSITPTGSLIEGQPTTLHGTAVIPITGSLPGTNASVSETLYVTSSHNPLPVYVTARVKHGGRSVGSTTMTFGGWGEPVAFTPPERALPISELAAFAKQRSILDVPGSPAYTTYTGPYGYPGPAGRPWGQPCKPVVLVAQSNVPQWVYDQSVAVVNEARQHGVDVAIERRNFYWTPSQLYYLDGQTYKTAAFVHIWVDYTTPTTLATGRPEHMQLGWDTKIDADGRNEDFTGIDGTLHMRVLAGQPEFVRRSVRQLIAMTQGVLSTSNPSSGIADATNVDRFTPSDITAMLHMSGCVR